MSAQEPLTQRDVESLRTTIDQLVRVVEALPDKIADTYVRKDVLGPRLDAIEKAQQDHEKRLRKAERWMWAQVGAAATFGSAIGTLVNQIHGGA